jgi:predicted site-specific integrase-resolvase
MRNLSKKRWFFIQKQGLAGLAISSNNGRMNYGYARVSTDDQKADLQIALAPWS